MTRRGIRSRFWGWKMRRRRRRVVKNMREPYRSFVREQDRIAKTWKKLK